MTITFNRTQNDSFNLGGEIGFCNKGSCDGGKVTYKRAYYLHVYIGFYFLFVSIDK